MFRLQLSFGTDSQGVASDTNEASVVAVRRLLAKLGASNQGQEPGSDKNDEGDGGGGGRVGGEQREAFKTISGVIIFSGKIVCTPLTFSSASSSPLLRCFKSIHCWESNVKLTWSLS